MADANAGDGRLEISIAGAASAIWLTKLVPGAELPCRIGVSGSGSVARFGAAPACGGIGREGPGEDGAVSGSSLFGVSFAPNASSVCGQGTADEIGGPGVPRRSAAASTWAPSSALSEPAAPRGGTGARTV